MYIRIVGNCFSQKISNEIEAITNYGILYFQKMKYDKKKKMISIPIERCKIRAIKKIVLGTTTSYKYDKKNRIAALILINNILSCKIENNFNDPAVTKMRILFGLQLNIKDKKISIASVEEDRGQTCYSIDLKLSEIDIEISDQIRKKQKKEVSGLHSSRNDFFD